jgi:hypothetical protein
MVTGSLQCTLGQHSFSPSPWVQNTEALFLSALRNIGGYCVWIFAVVIVIVGNPGRLWVSS